MALQKSYEACCGSTYATSYSKITSMNARTLDRAVDITLSVYKDATARADLKVPVGYYSYHYEGDDYDAIYSVTAMDPVDTNPIKLAYDKIKVLPEWSGAIDV